MGRSGISLGSGKGVMQKQAEGLIALIASRKILVGGDVDDVA